MTENPVAIVTAAGRGMGAACARELLSEEAGYITRRTCGSTVG